MYMKQIIKMIHKLIGWMKLGSPIVWKLQIAHHKEWSEWYRSTCGIFVYTIVKKIIIIAYSYTSLFHCDFRAELPLCDIWSHQFTTF